MFLRLSGLGKKVIYPVVLYRLCLWLSIRALEVQVFEVSAFPERFKA